MPSEHRFIDHLRWIYLEVTLPLFFAALGVVLIVIQYCVTETPPPAPLDRWTEALASALGSGDLLLYSGLLVLSAYSALWAAEPGGRHVIRHPGVALFLLVIAVAILATYSGLKIPTHLDKTPGWSTRERVACGSVVVTFALLTILHVILFVFQLAFVKESTVVQRIAAHYVRP